MCDVRRQEAWAEEALKLVAADQSVLNKRNYKNMTPLMVACCQGYREREKASTITVCFENIVRTYVVLPKRTYVRTYMRAYLQRAYMRAYVMLTHVSTYLRYVRTYVCTYLYVCMYVQTYARTYVPAYVQWIRTSIYVRSYVRTYVRTYVLTHFVVQPHVSTYVRTWGNIVLCVRTYVRTENLANGDVASAFVSPDARYVRKNTACNGTVASVPSNTEDLRTCGRMHVTYVPTYVSYFSGLAHVCSQ